MKSPFVQRCSGEDGVDEVVPKMKSPFVEKRSSGEGVVLVDNHGFQKVTLQSPLGACADVADCQQVAEVFHDEKIPVHEKQEDCNARQDLKSKHDKEFKF